MSEHIDDRLVLLVTVPGIVAHELLELLDEGQLPAFHHLVCGGALGFIEDRPSTHWLTDLWTAATGCPETLHDVRHSHVVMPALSGVYPLGRNNVLVDPCWEVAAKQGIPACAIGWPGTRGSHEDNLFVVSEDVARPIGKKRSDWPLMPGGTNRPGLNGHVMRLRVHPSEILDSDIDHLLLRKSSPELRERLRKAFAANCTYQAICLYVLQRRAAQFLALNLDFLLHSRFQRRDNPSRHERASPYKVIDMFLAKLIDAMPSDASVFVASPGFKGRGTKVNVGSLIMWGKNFCKDILVDEVRLVDIAPSVLHALGGSIPSSWPGRVLATGWKAPFTENRLPIEIFSCGTGERWAVDQINRHNLSVGLPLGKKRDEVEALARIWNRG